jgi:hypothetical protein
MLTENTNKNPAKPYNQTIPKSQQDGGTNLDEGCGAIETAATPGIDKSAIPMSDVGRLGFDGTIKAIDSGRKSK